MRKRWLVIGGLISVVAVVTAGILWFTRTKTDNCTQLIKALAKNDSQKSYATFSRDLKGQIKYSDWQQNVPGYYYSYENYTELKQTDKQKGTTTNNAPTTAETYSIVAPAGSYTFTCSTAKSGHVFEVTGFTSRFK